MIDGLRLELRDIEPIVKADLDINKINIIGGKNATGKSTASKLLYCFLKVNSSDKDILLTSIIKKELDDIYRQFDFRYRNDPSVAELTNNIKMKDSLVSENTQDSDIPDPFYYEDEFIDASYRIDDNPAHYESFITDNYGYNESDMYNSNLMEDDSYADMMDEYYEPETIEDNIKNPYESEIIENIRRLWSMLVWHDYDNFEQVIDFFNQIEPPITELLEAEAARESARPTPVFRPKASFFEKLLFKWNKIKRIFNSFEDYFSDFFKEVMKDLISSEFNIDFSLNTESEKRSNNEWPSKTLPNNESPRYRINHAKLFDSLNSDFSFEVNLNDIGNEFKSEGEFQIGNVFYLESYSIFDNFSTFKEEYLHVEELEYFLRPRDNTIRGMFKLEFKGELEKKVNQIIGGRMVNNNGKFCFAPNNSSYFSSMKNTASGVKQIALIETLLHNGFLLDGSVLIMDEPEVNLHPEWQIKLAHILVLLAKEGNITIYINSHSPMFIEAMDTFSEYYDFEEHVNYYLSEIIESDETEVGSQILNSKENKVIFKKIPNDELYRIYDDLGDPLDYLDKVRLMKGKKGVENDFYI